MRQKEAAKNSEVLDKTKDESDILRDLMIKTSPRPPRHIRSILIELIELARENQIN